MKLDRSGAVRRAVALAALSPLPDPNPRVGCVIVSTDGSVIAEGYHRGAGTPHAEAAAIAQVNAFGVDLRGATAYVTLEPCAHQGRTPSCARALVAAGVARVIYGQGDPNGAAAGGAGILADAGIAVEDRSREHTSVDRCEVSVDTTCANDCNCLLKTLCSSTAPSNGSCNGRVVHCP